MKIDWKSTFKELLKEHVKKGYLRDKRVQRILGEIPLERIFDEIQLERFILQDAPALIYFKDPKNARTCSAPHMISMMTSMMELSENDRVLILGSKGGVIESVIANIVKDVFILEEVEEVASITEEAFIKLGLENVWVRNQNPIYGLEEEGPFTRILITGAIPYIPHILLEQLSPNGILVAPLMLNHPQFQSIFKIIKNPNVYEEKRIQKTNPILPKFEIINHGGVIFSPLIFKSAPQINLTQDITLKTIIKYSKDYKKPQLLEVREFFEELQDIPPIDIAQVVFSENDDISVQCLECERDERELGNDIIITKDCELYVFNPGEYPLDVKLRIDIKETKEANIFNFHTLQPKSTNKIPFTISLPFEENVYNTSFTLISSGDFRISHSEGKLYVIKEKGKWNISIELQNNI